MKLHVKNSSFAICYIHMYTHMWLYVTAGNDNIHLLTSRSRQRLRVDLGDFDGNHLYAEYDDFAVDSAFAKYNLSSLGQYSGNASQCVTCTLHTLCQENLK